MASWKFMFVALFAAIASIQCENSYDVGTNPKWAFEMYTYQINNYPGAREYFNKVSGGKKFQYVVKTGSDVETYLLDYSSWPVGFKTGAAAAKSRFDLKMTMTAKMFNEMTAPYLSRDISEAAFEKEFNTNVNLSKAVSNGEIKFEGDFIQTMNLHKLWRFDYYIRQIREREAQKANPTM